MPMPLTATGNFIGRSWLLLLVIFSRTLISSSDGSTACGGLHILDSRVDKDQVIVQTPDIGQDLPDGLKCQWSVVSVERKALKVRFLYFDLGNSSTNCRHENLQVDLSGTCGFLDPAIFCGTVNPPPVTVGNVVCFRLFTGDCLKHHRGFRVEVQIAGSITNPYQLSVPSFHARQLQDRSTAVPPCHVLPVMIYSSAQILSPRGPFTQFYPPNSMCRWLVYADVYHEANLEFDFIEMEYHRRCKYDYVKLVTGEETHPDFSVLYCGIKIPLAQKLLSPILIIFSSDKNVQYRGFGINVDVKALPTPTSITTTAVATKTTYFSMFESSQSSMVDFLTATGYYSEYSRYSSQYFITDSTMPELRHIFHSTLINQSTKIYPSTASISISSYSDILRSSSPMYLTRYSHFLLPVSQHILSSSNAYDFSPKLLSENMTLSSTSSSPLLHETPFVTLSSFRSLTSTLSTTIVETSPSPSTPSSSTKLIISNFLSSVLQLSSLPSATHPYRADDKLWPVDEPSALPSPVMSPSGLTLTMADSGNPIITPTDTESVAVSEDKSTYLDSLDSDPFPLEIDPSSPFDFTTTPPSFQWPPPHTKTWDTQEKSGIGTILQGTSINIIHPSFGKSLAMSDDYSASTLFSKIPPSGTRTQPLSLISISGPPSTPLSEHGPQISSYHSGSEKLLFSSSSDLPKYSQTPKVTHSTPRNILTFPLKQDSSILAFKQMSSPIPIPDKDSPQLFSAMLTQASLLSASISSSSSLANGSSKSSSSFVDRERSARLLPSSDPFALYSSAQPQPVLRSTPSLGLVLHPTSSLSASLSLLSPMSLHSVPSLSSLSSSSLLTSALSYPSSFLFSSFSSFISSSSSFPPFLSFLLPSSRSHEYYSDFFPTPMTQNGSSASSTAVKEKYSDVSFATISEGPSDITFISIAAMSTIIGDGLSAAIPTAIGGGSIDLIPATISEGSSDVLITAIAEISKEVIPTTTGEGSSDVIPTTTGEGPSDVFPPTILEGSNDVLITTFSEGSDNAISTTIGEDRSDATPTANGEGHNDVIPTTISEDPSEIPFTAFAEGLNDTILATITKDSNDAISTIIGVDPSGITLPAITEDHNNILPTVIDENHRDVTPTSIDENPNEITFTVIAEDHYDTIPTTIGAGYSDVPTTIVEGPNEITFNTMTEGPGDTILSAITQGQSESIPSSITEGQKDSISRTTGEDHSHTIPTAMNEDPSDTFPTAIDEGNSHLLHTAIYGNQSDVTPAIISENKVAVTDTAHTAGRNHVSSVSVSIKDGVFITPSPSRNNGDGTQADETLSINGDSADYNILSQNPDVTDTSSIHASATISHEDNTDDTEDNDILEDSTEIGSDKDNITVTNTPPDASAEIKVDICERSRYPMTAGKITVQSPGVDVGRYPTNVVCDLLLIASKEMDIKIHFTQFRLEYHFTCNYDFLEIYTQDENPSFDFIGRLCGVQHPDDITLTNVAVLRLKFVSDAIVTSVGLRLILEVSERSDTPVCKAGRTLCSNHTLCIPEQWRCDAEEDCPGGSDEKECDFCTADEFRCANNSCLPLSRVCDDERDCEYGEDEKRCVRNQNTTHGVLEVCMAGSWHPVCADSMNGLDLHNEYLMWACEGMGMGSPLSVSLQDANGSYQNLTQFIHLVSSPDAAPHQNEIQIAKNVSTVCHTRTVISLTCGVKACGKKETHLPQPYVLGPVPSINGQWPWTAAIFTKDNFKCGASIISDRWILTASHCVYKFTVSPQNAVIKVGDVNVQSPDAQRFRISEVILHPDNTYIRKNDVALIRLAEEIPFSSNQRAVCLPSQQNRSLNSVCYVAGWGPKFQPNIASGKPLPVLHHAKVKLWSLDRCQESFPGQIRSTMICAGYEHGEIDACKGDSGGPLMCRNDHDIWTVEGVVSWGEGCGTIGKAGVYTKVASYLPWIRRVTDPSDTNVNCSFETSNMCGYDVQSNTTFTWTRRKGGYNYPPRLESDHTFKNSTGHYAYAYVPDGARYLSTILSPPALETTSPVGVARCLRSYVRFKLCYRCKLILISHDSLGNKVNLMQYSSTGREHSWLGVEVSLPVTTQAVSLLAMSDKFTGGGIGLDDVTLTDSTCHGQSVVTCSFDEGHLCQYAQNSDDDFSWQWSPGSEAETGGYITTRSIKQGLRRDKARIVSPPLLEGEGYKCLSFRLRLTKGVDGSLQVCRQIYLGGSKISDCNVWTSQGLLDPSHGVVWKSFKIPVPSLNLRHSIVFQATRGSGETVLDLDDIHLWSGDCELK